jgi:hypothetical protein
MRRDGAKMELIWGKSEAVYFCRPSWTTQITLKWLVKFDLWRSGFCGVLDERRAIDACGFARRATGYQRVGPPQA